MKETNLIDWTAYGLGLYPLTIWREARGEPFEGQLAVAYSILDRVDNPKWWGRSLHEVLTMKWQYSSLAAPGDPQLILYPKPGDKRFEYCMLAASAALNRLVPNPVPAADSYYAVSIPAPNWAEPSKLVAQVGNHKFYNLDGSTEENALQNKDLLKALAA